MDNKVNLSKFMYRNLISEVDGDFLEPDPRVYRHFCPVELYMCVITKI